LTNKEPEQRLRKVKHSKNCRADADPMGLSIKDVRGQGGLSSADKGEVVCQICVFRRSHFLV